MEDADNFGYLGATVITTGGAEQDIRARLGKARAAFNKLSTIWWDSQLSNVIFVLFWDVAHDWRWWLNKLNTFQHRCLRRIFKIYWPMKVSNEGSQKKSKIRCGQHSSEEETVVVAWSCVTNREGYDPTHRPHLGTRGEEKEKTTKRDMETNSGKRTTGVGSKISGQGLYCCTC